MGKKCYAVKEGRKTGIFHTWAECKVQIDGYSGAIYKGFESVEAAENFLRGGSTKSQKQSEAEVIAYVDGSYNVLTKKYAYGCVILLKDKTLEFSGVGEEEENTSMRNVAGEILGSMTAIKWAVENGWKSIDIFYDYEGIQRWAEGTWKANKKGTMDYVNFIKEYKQQIDIRFVKVLAHSGVEYNELADRLAKSALGL